MLGKIETVGKIRKIEKWKNMVAKLITPADRHVICCHVVYININEYSSSRIYFQHSINNQFEQKWITIKFSL